MIQMDIAALSTGMNILDVNTDAGVLMLSKNLDLIETMGDGMVKMMEQSVAPHLGANIDISI